MLCPKCGKEGIEPGDAFCRHCGFALAPTTSVTQRVVGIAEKRPVSMADSDASKGLQTFGVAILLVTLLIATVVAYSIGLPNFGGSVLPWLMGALLLAGLVMLVIGFELRRTH
ncbi:MAG TPA: zinc ribbon domain-containing protein [Candidatus Dormibacteraeota bacterium]|nr:zinc ribbon domain-containing protein [Candidatus Dormibacteraeota bacterium]